MKTEYLAEALCSFSGYLAADELYDGPFCVLSLVDNHFFRRLAYRVLDHNATAADVQAFFTDFKQQLDQRGLTVRGMTTDGAPLYPEPMAQVFPGVPHQVCEFHVLKELNKQVLRSLAKERKSLVAEVRKGALDAKSKRLRKRKRELFEGRTLFVKKKLTETERRELRRLVRGHPELRVLREIVEEVYRLFDRRCRTETALKKLAKLRRRVKRHDGLEKTLSKLFGTNLEKALTFLDDRELVSTSNAVERGNRRHRKMQKVVYRTRSARQLNQRMAMDLLRESQAVGRLHTGTALHRRRARPQAPL